jgi:hypothetical protein
MHASFGLLFVVPAALAAAPIAALTPSTPVLVHRVTSYGCDMYKFELSELFPTKTEHVVSDIRL